MSERRRSSYTVLTRNEELELSAQKREVMMNSIIAANGVLVVAAACIGSTTMFTDMFTVSDLLVLLIGGGASIVGAFGSVIEGIKYHDLKETIYSMPEKRGPR